jgi:glycine cleavage system transcriptional repressor
MQMLKYLAVTVLGTTEHDLANELAKITASSTCNIVTSHISRLGNESVANLLLSGTWSAIAKVEASFPVLEQKQGINVLIRRTEMLSPADDVLPYSAFLVAIDRPGIIYKITHFFAEQQININELTTDSYTARQSSTVMLTISMRINIPIAMHIADLRERFILFCDDLNIDAILEPERN